MKVYDISRHKLCESDFIHISLKSVSQTEGNGFTTILVGNVDAFDMSVDAFDNSYILIKKVRSLCQSVLQC